MIQPTYLSSEKIVFGISRINPRVMVPSIPLPPHCTYQDDHQKSTPNHIKHHAKTRELWISKRWIEENHNNQDILTVQIPREPFNSRYTLYSCRSCGLM